MKKLRGISLFANVGVAEALLDTIDAEILIANEIDEQRALFYKELYPKTNMICGDITKKEVQREIIQLARKEKINFIMATPPCQGMSEAGKRNEFDERNQLIVQTIELINEIKPDFIFIENVPTILKTKIIVNGKIEKIPDYVRSELSKNYILNKETLVRAMDYGVPQMRSRNIFLAVKKELNITWSFPKKDEEIITLKKAFKNIPSIDPMLREGLDLTLKKFPHFLEKKENGLLVSKWHKPPVHSWKQVEWMLHTPSATSAIYNEKYFPQKDNGVRIKAHHNNYRRMDWNKPSRTMTQNNGVISSLCCVHPGNKIKNTEGNYYSDPRVLTIYELLVVTSLPIDWAIPDWAKDNFIRKVIGEGIPPLLVKKIILNLLKEIK